jgi:hypothetical protein
MVIGMKSAVNSSTKLRGGRIAIADGSFLPSKTRSDCGCLRYHAVIYWYLELWRWRL